MNVPIRNGPDCGLARERAGARRVVLLKRGQIAEELSCAVFPGALERKRPAGLPRHGKRAQACAAQIRVQGADRVIRDHV